MANRWKNASTPHFYRRLIPYIKPHWRIFALAIFGMVLYSAAEAGFAISIKPLVDEGLAVKGSGQFSLWLPLIIFFILLARGAGNFISIYFLTAVGELLMRSLRSDLFHHIVHASVASFQQHSRGSIVAKMSYNINAISYSASKAVTTLVKDSLTVIALSAWLIYINWQLSLSVLFVAPLVGMSVWFAARRFRQVSRRIQKMVGVIAEQVQQTIQANREIKVFNAQAYEQRSFEKNNHYAFQQAMKFALVKALASPVAMLFAGLSLVLVVHWVISGTIAVDASPGSLASFLVSLLLLFRPLRNLVRLNSIIQPSVAAAGALFEFIDEPIEQIKRPDHTDPTTPSRPDPTTSPHAASYRPSHTDPTTPSHAASYRPGHTDPTTPPHAVSRQPDHTAPTTSPHAASYRPGHAASYRPDHTASSSPDHTAPTTSPHAASHHFDHAASYRPDHTDPTTPSHAASYRPGHAASYRPNHAASPSPNHAASSSPDHTAPTTPSHAVSHRPDHTDPTTPSHAASYRPNHTDRTTPSRTASSHPDHAAPPRPGQLRFDQVSLCYADNRHLALHNICLDIAAGETVAIVGHSGSGKSSLVNLIPRFYEPSSGRVLIDGCDIKAMGLYELREHISYVGQSASVLNDTVSNNIAYGCDASHEQVIAAASSAQALEFINKMPHGFDSQLSNDGSGLSAGERQRIAIARAFIKAAPILILDEATSALDAAAEGAIQQAIKSICKERTTLLIAHRLSTIRHIPRIVVMSAGHLVEQGDHDSLMKQSGIYADLYRHYQDHII